MILLTPTSTDIPLRIQENMQPNNQTQFIVDKQDAIKFKDDLENEMKLYLKGALKKMMAFKKELKADLIFTK